MKTVNGHFDGKNIVLDEPIALKPNTKVKVVAADEEDTEADLMRACARLSEPTSAKIWDNPLDAQYERL